MLKSYNFSVYGLISSVRKWHFCIDFRWPQRTSLNLPEVALNSRSSWNGFRFKVNRSENLGEWVHVAWLGKRAIKKMKASFNRTPLRIHMGNVWKALRTECSFSLKWLIQVNSFYLDDSCSTSLVFIQCWAVRRKAFSYQHSRQKVVDHKEEV